jgi:hypothetical protein
MADRFRLALLTIALCLLPLTAGAQKPSPSFAVRIEGRGPAMILIVGWTLGLTCGTLGLVLGMWLLG